jgi:hypothetical protein
MEILTHKDIREFIEDWITQSPAKLEKFCKKYACKHYSSNSDLFLDIEDVLIDIIEENGFDWRSLDEGEIGAPKHSSWSVDLPKKEEVPELFEVSVSEATEKYFGKVQSRPSINTDIVNYWIATAKMSFFEIDYFLLETEFIPIDDHLFDSTTLNKISKKNYDDLLQELFKILNLVLKKLEFQFEIVDILKENLTNYPPQKMTLLSHYSEGLPKLDYSCDLEESKERFETVQDIFKKNKETVDTKISNTIRKKRGRKQAPVKAFFELIESNKLERYKKGKGRFIEFCSPFKGSDMAYVCMAFQNLSFLPQDLNKKTLHTALQQEISIKMDYTGFTMKFKQENFQTYQKEISLKETELKRIFSIN